MEFDETKILHYLTKDVKRTKKQMKRLETFKEIKMQGLVKHYEEVAKREKAALDLQTALQAPKKWKNVEPTILPDLSEITVAEQEYRKEKMIGSIVRSMRMQGKKSDMQCETMSIPSMESFQDMSLADMRDLRLSRISWRRISNHYIDMICVELNDGQKQKAGPV